MRTSASESFTTSQKHNLNNRVSQDATPRLDAIEQQMALITQLVSMLTQLMSRTFKPKAEPLQRFNSAKNNLQTFFRQFERFCDVTYPNQSEDWVTVLGNYLKGTYSDLY